MEIYTPLVEQLKLQVKVNQAKRTVHLRVCALRHASISSHKIRHPHKRQKQEHYKRAQILFRHLFWALKCGSVTRFRCLEGCITLPAQDALALLRVDDLYIDSFMIQDGLAFIAPVRVRRFAGSQGSPWGPSQPCHWAHRRSRWLGKVRHRKRDQDTNRSCRFVCSGGLQKLQLIASTAQACPHFGLFHAHSHGPERHLQPDSGSVASASFQFVSISGSRFPTKPGLRAPPVYCRRSQPALLKGGNCRAWYHEGPVCRVFSVRCDCCAADIPPSPPPSPSRFSSRFLVPVAGEARLAASPQRQTNLTRKKNRALVCGYFFTRPTLLNPPFHLLLIAASASVLPRRRRTCPRRPPSPHPARRSCVGTSNDPARHVPHPTATTTQMEGS